MPRQSRLLDAHGARQACLGTGQRQDAAAGLPLYCLLRPQLRQVAFFPASNSVQTSRLHGLRRVARECTRRRWLGQFSAILRLELLPRPETLPCAKKNMLPKPALPHTRGHLLLWRAYRRLRNGRRATYRSGAQDHTIAGEPRWLVFAILTPWQQQKNRL